MNRPKTYKPSGNDKIGWRLHIPTKATRYQRYVCLVFEDGTLTYVPVKP